MTEEELKKWEEETKSFGIHVDFEIDPKGNLITMQNRLLSLIDLVRKKDEALNKLKWSFTPPKINEWSKNPDNEAFTYIRETCEQALAIKIGDGKE